jgi:hypothetical protein
VVPPSETPPNEALGSSALNRRELQVRGNSVNRHKRVYVCVSSKNSQEIKIGNLNLHSLLES